jgi:hypothetical protein
VNPKEFLAAIAEINMDQPFYGGTLVNFGKHPFVSGANLMMNSKTIEILLKAQKEWNHGLLDDVAIGRILENRVSITPLRSMNISKVTQVHKIPKIEFTQIMHFRCKSDEIIRNDIEIIHEVKERIINGK